MWVDLVGQLIEIIPLLPKFRRLMSRSQQIAVLPLYVVDDAAAVQAAMQTDGDEARLASHEAGSFCHHSQRLGLLVWLGLDNCDLCDELFVGLDLRHGRPHFIELNHNFAARFHRIQYPFHQSWGRAAAENLCVTARRHSKTLTQQSDTGPSASMLAGIFEFLTQTRTRNSCITRSSGCSVEKLKAVLKARTDRSPACRACGAPGRVA